MLGSQQIGDTMFSSGDLTSSLLARGGTFVDNFCDPSLTTADFQGQLGSYTPCFTDVVLLGVAHVVAILLCLARLYALFQPRCMAPRYRICGPSRALHVSAALASLGCLIIVLFQVHGRIAGQALLGLAGSRIAPYEGGVYFVSTLSWALFAATYAAELARYSPFAGTTWLARLGVAFVTAAQIAKLRLVLQLAESRTSYFFVLYVIYVALQLYLTALALAHWPMGSRLQLREDLATYLLLEASGEKPVCPEVTCGLYDWATFGWCSPLLLKGYRRALEFSDIWAIPPAEAVHQQAQRFRGHWSRELAKEDPSIVLALWKTTAWLYLVALPYKLVNDASTFVGPIFLALLVGVVDGGGPLGLGYVYAVLMFIGLVIGTIADAQHYQLCMRGGYRMRSILVHSIFRKVLSLTPSARSRFSSGFIFNLVTQDTEQLQLLTQNISSLISSPLRIIIAIVLLYIQLGPSALVAPAVFVLALPVQAWLVRGGAVYLNKSLVHTDERAKVEAELLAGIEVVKCSTWEVPFTERIAVTRTAELAHLWRAFISAAWNSFLFNLTPVAVAVLAFGTYVALGNDLSAAQAFTSMSLFTLLRIPLFMLPQLITQLINTLVGLRRIQLFLAAEEQPGIQLLPPAPKGETTLSLEGSYTWDLALAPALHDISLKVPSGSLVAVVGPTGSGKTSLLASCLGLTQCASGRGTQLRGSVAYVSQSAFLYNATVRDNILFGGADPPDEERYQEAIRVASLTRDLTLLPAGDLTELGDRGVNVSGGQKQRISIARAYYANADIYLFDDPLSALDAKVGRAVFNNCMANGLADRTRLLATNQLQFVAAADTVVFMSGGRIAEMGTYRELMAADGGFAQMMAQAEQGDEDDDDIDESDFHVEIPPELIKPVAGAALAKKGTEEDGKLVEVEGMSRGRLSLRTVGVYVRAMGGIFVAIRLLSWVVYAEGLRIGAIFWLQRWTAETAIPETAPHGTGYYIIIYAIIGAAQVVMILISRFVLKWDTIRAGDVLHSDMLARILRAPMSFFHTTPLGRTINRLTKDVSDIDKNLGDFAFFFCVGFLQLVGTTLSIAISTPFAFVVVGPILVMFVLFYSYFQSSAREVKRMDSVSRSPLYGTISEAINGVPTIRAYRAEARLTSRNAQLVDDNVVMQHVTQSMGRWLSVRLEILGAVAALASALLAIEQGGGGSVLGLTVSNALGLSAVLNWVVLDAAIAENGFNAVERVSEYSDLDTEAAEEVPGSIPPGWPAKGRVEFRGVQMRYRPGLPLVLRGLSVTVEAGNKCGVVGRTGAGKSSLINSLFRLMELDGGAIVIDGVDIAKIGLKQLRSNLSLIPQVPVLFTGTLRANLDPFGEHGDEAIWTSLRRAHLDGVAEAAPLGLDLILSEGGQPLSAGQKQLVALARALLRSSKVLVLDEATANVDVETDALIQATVRREFRDNTIIAVAHRLHTVIDCDSVLVMDAGQAAEYGSPGELLAMKDGIFASMVADTGDATAAYLRAVAAGEVSIAAHLEAQAERARSKKARTAARASEAAAADRSAESEELAARAKAAADAISFCLSALREDGQAAATGAELGLSGGAGAFPEVDRDAAELAMAQALQVVTDIQALADQARHYLARHPELASDQPRLSAEFPLLIQEPPSFLPGSPVEIPLARSGLTDGRAPSWSGSSGDGAGSSSGSSEAGS